MTTIETDQEEAVVNVPFSAGAYAVLQELVAATGKPLLDLLSDAIALQRWVIETRRNGWKLMVQKPDGLVHEVTIK
ncbi:MAG: hypothetical protein ACYDH6_07520 [Acidimicrobiales bacterium]